MNKFIPLTKSKSRRNIIFLFIGRLLKDKGLVEYIEAIKIVKQMYNNVEFQILGSIENTNVTVVPEVEVREWIETGLVSYLGKTDSVERVISDCDCVVLPSYREGLPRSLLEAGAMEKPVIATDVPGCRDVVDDGINGFLCKVKNSQDLADKISLMVNLTADQRSSMGKAGRTKVLKEFDENIIFNKYLTSIKLIFKNTNK